MAKVMAAMSGGVDSSVAAALLKEQDYDTLGATLRLYEESDSVSREVLAAKEVCDRLGIEHIVYDMRDRFEKEVIRRFRDDYSNGLTPNPCVECNKYIKFGALLDKALEENCDYIATGHYSRIAYNKESGRYILYRPDDIKKDQTYVLWQLTQKQLSHILMPLGDITKQEVRELARSYGFASADAKESQDICFVPDGDYGAFLERYSGKPLQRGSYLDMDGRILGEHLGQERYTIGQRKGLGIALGKPQFVISKQPESNTVVLGDEEYLFKKRIYIRDINMVAAELPAGPISCTAKLRYGARDEACLLHPLSENEALLEFEQPQRAATAGQSAVFYLADALLGGGKITGAE